MVLNIICGLLYVTPKEQSDDQGFFLGFENCHTAKPINRWFQKLGHWEAELYAVRLDEWPFLKEAPTTCMWSDGLDAKSCSKIERFLVCMATWRCLNNDFGPSGPLRHSLRHSFALLLIITVLAVLIRIIREDRHC